jgi:type III secretory pathway component EscU
MGLSIGRLFSTKTRRPSYFSIAVIDLTKKISSSHSMIETLLVHPSAVVARSDAVAN